MGNQEFQGLSKQTGQVLLVVIVGFLAASALGLGMVALTTTSTYSELLSNRAQKAYALAESGGRLAIPWIKRDLAGATTKLNNQTFSRTDGSFSIVIDNTPSAFTLVQSTGIVNSGGFFETRKLINYVLPKITPPYENRDWTDGALEGGDGSYEIVSVDGSNALHVTDTSHGGSFKQDATVGFTVGSPNAPNFANVWLAGGNLLSYRAQVKILDSPADDHYMAGISVRVTSLTDLGDSLGISYIRSDRNDKHTGIPDSLIPLDCVSGTYLNDVPMLLLWTQNNSQGSNARIPLAYHILDLSRANNLYVVDSSDHLLDWVTLFISIQEKVLLADSSQFNAGDRVNDIKVYVSNQGAHGVNDTPLDPTNPAVRMANPRTQIMWPPDDGNDTTTSNDFFTLVQWTRSGTVSCVDGSLEILGSGKESNAIIRTDLATTSSTSYVNRPEIALVTFGNDADHIYFDDFGIDFPPVGGSTDFVQY